VLCIANDLTNNNDHRSSNCIYWRKGSLLDNLDHSHGEDSFILLGLSSKLRILVVSHTLRNDDQDNKDYFRPQGNPFETRAILDKVAGMREEYDFKSPGNPCARLLKKQVTIRLDQGIVTYGEASIVFSRMSRGGALSGFSAIYDFLSNLIYDCFIRK
jgi:hypothetical protein